MPFFRRPPRFLGASSDGAPASAEAGEVSRAGPLPASGAEGATEAAAVSAEVSGATASGFGVGAGAGSARLPSLGAGGVAASGGDGGLGEIRSALVPSTGAETRCSELAEGAVGAGTGGVVSVGLGALVDAGSEGAGVFSGVAAGGATSEGGASRDAGALAGASEAAATGEAGGTGDGRSASTCVGDGGGAVGEGVETGAPSGRVASRIPA